MRNDYTSFLLVQLTSSLAKASALLSTVTLNDFYVESNTTTPEDDSSNLLTAVDAFNKVVACKKLIDHAEDLADVLADSVLE